MLHSDQVKHIPALDGLRGVAILLVISFHYFPGFQLFSLGWSGVDLFFVLSGYLITGRLLSSLHDPDYFKKFYRNRVLRIFPLYYAVLVLFFSAIYFFAKDENRGLLSFYTIHWKSFFLFTENWTFIRYGLPHDVYLVHFWSLAIEEQFYFVWPLVVLFLVSGRSRLKTWCLATIGVVLLRIFIYSHNAENGNYQAYYNNTLCRVDSLMIGAILSQLHFDHYRIRNKLIYVLMLIFSIILLAGIFSFGSAKLSTAFMATGGYTCLALFYACFVHLAVNGQTFTARLLCNPFLCFCGKISFGLYVFHWPVVLILGSRILNWGLARFPQNGFSLGILSGIISIIITFGISYFSYTFYETYFLSLKKTAR